jgi:anti-sigma regulatory factor (Ser/Thr protein kinase)
VPHVLPALGDARLSVRDFLVRHKVDEGVTEDLILCGEEACANAMRHSGSEAPVRLTVSLSQDAVEAVVSDEGRGIDVDSLRLAGPPEPFARGGRGLYLIKSIADSVEILGDGGTQVRIRVHTGRRRTGVACAGADGGRESVPSDG